MDGFGPALRAAREAAGLSVEQVSSATRLRPAVVRDLEDGDVSSSGGAVYARGHVRSIAGVVGADPAPLLAALDAQVGRPVVPDIAVEPLRAARAGALQVPRAEAPEPTAPRWGSAAVVACTLLVVLLGIGVLSGRDDPSGEDLLAAGPSPAAPAPSPTATVAPVAAPAPAPAPAPVGTRLGVRAVAGDSWVRVQAGDRLVFEGTLAAGTPAKDFGDAGELRLTVGNAGALRLSCGGALLEPAGGQGEVKRFACSPSGLAPA